MAALFFCYPNLRPSCCCLGFLQVNRHVAPILNPRSIQQQSRVVHPCCCSAITYNNSVVQDALHFVNASLLSQEKQAGFMDRGAILKRIADEHSRDCRQAAEWFVVEEKNHNNNNNTIDYEWIHIAGRQEKNKPLALRSLQPVLNATSRAAIVGAAERRWQRRRRNASSRFTYQRRGNYEAHVSDLGLPIQGIINEALLHTIYPLIRHAMVGEETLLPRDQRLCVYDALVIRYNATEAQSSSTTSSTNGAGQPLHRDLGMVSINIMLNGADEFQGGGTFFDRQLLNDNTNTTSNTTPLSPLHAGHCLAHSSQERHAGASTRGGVRDILVMFLLVTTAKNKYGEQEYAPAVLRNARLKQCRTFCSKELYPNRPLESILCRMAHHCLAIQALPEDGEAYQYLGTALLDYDSATRSLQNPTTSSSSTDRMLVLQAAVACLQHACALTPCDARNFNNLGLALGQLASINTKGGPLDDDFESSISRAYLHGLELLQRSQRAGCDVEGDLDSLLLNFGLHLANQNQFSKAADVLQGLAAKKEIQEESSGGRIVEDGYRLWRFCEKNR